MADATSSRPQVDGILEKSLYVGRQVVGAPTVKDSWKNHSQGTKRKNANICLDSSCNREFPAFTFSERRYLLTQYGHGEGLLPSSGLSGDISLKLVAWSA